MSTVPQWSGREVRALREARRMSVREFAAHLGVSDRMVSKWEAGGVGIRPRPVNQAALDTSLAQAPAEAKARFALIVTSATTQPQPAALASQSILDPTAAMPPRSTLAATAVSPAQRPDMVNAPRQADPADPGRGVATVAPVPITVESGPTASATPPPRTDPGACSSPRPGVCVLA